MSQRQHLKYDTCYLAIARLQTGSTQSEVADEFGVSQSVVNRLQQRYHGTGWVNEEDAAMMILLL